MLDKRASYINGAWSAPETARDFEVFNPSTEQPCAVISLGDQANTDRTAVAARGGVGRLEEVLEVKSVSGWAE